MMLVLTRAVGERIRIGDGIVVEVCEVRGDKVRLGITADPTVPVHREEVWLKIKEQANNADRNEANDPTPDVRQSE